jgi:hypothetical protein
VIRIIPVAIIPVFGVNLFLRVIARGIVGLVRASKNRGGEKAQ